MVTFLSAETHYILLQRMVEVQDLPANKWKQHIIEYWKHGLEYYRYWKSGQSIYPSIPMAVLHHAHLLLPQSYHSGG